MPSESVRSLRSLLSCSSRAPLRERAHVVGRFLSCPFPRLVERVPAGARVLDIGAGHGILAQLLANRGCQVVAVEPDVRKLWTMRASRGLRRVGGFADAVAGKFDAVTICDVLYRIPFAEWAAVFSLAAGNLRPGGLLLIKEIDPEKRWKGAWNRWQEALADRLGMTLGGAFSYETKERMAARLASCGLRSIATLDLGRWYPHAHVLYVAARGSSRGAPDRCYDEFA
jgi:2-polyprenyl-6-hydroxyphenyl methylase/3-demethylubiquinone-9 3-methyltransferase